MPMHNKNEMAVFHAMDFEKDAYLYRHRTKTKWKKLFSQMKKECEKAGGTVGGKKINSLKSPRPPLPRCGSR